MYHDKQKLNIKSFRENYEKRKKQRQDILAQEDSQDSKISEIDPAIEKSFVLILANKNLILPTNTKQLSTEINKQLSKTITVQMLHDLIQKLAFRKIIDVKDVATGYEIFQIDHKKLEEVYGECLGECKSEHSTDYSVDVKSKSWKWFSHVFPVIKDQFYF